MDCSSEEQEERSASRGEEEVYAIRSYENDLLTPTFTLVEVTNESYSK